MQQAASGPVRSLAGWSLPLISSSNGDTEVIDHTAPHISVDYDKYGRVIRSAANIYGEKRVECTVYNSRDRISSSTTTVDGILDYYSTTLYDDKGNILRETEHYAVNRGTYIKTYSYNPQGKITEEHWERTGESGSTLVDQYVYDQTGRTAMHIFFRKNTAIIDTIIYHYRKYDGTEADTGGYTTTTTYSNDESSNFYECAHSDSGALLWERGLIRMRQWGDTYWLRTYDAQGKVIMYATRGHEKWVDSMVMDRGKMSCRNYNVTDTSMWEASFFSYDMQGNPVRCDRFIYDSQTDFERGIGRLEWQEKMEYSYDSYGNWIEGVLSYNGRPREKFFRDITYYPDGYKTGEEFIPRHELH